MGLIDAVLGQRVYLDANIFIYALEGHARYLPVLSDLFKIIDRDEAQAVTSELTLAEVLVKPFADASTDRQAAYQQAASNDTATVSGASKANSRIRIHPRAAFHGAT